MTRPTVTGIVFADLNGNGFYDEVTQRGLGGVSDRRRHQRPAGRRHRRQRDRTAPASCSRSLTVTVDETTTPVDSECTTGNSPQSATTTSVLQFANIGFQVKPKAAKPDSSIGNGLAFYNDTVYGGAGSDFPRRRIR